MAKKRAKTYIFLIFASIFMIFASLTLVACGEKNVKVESIVLPHPIEEMFLGQEMYLSYEVYPKKATGYRVAVSSSNGQVISVGAGGQLIASNYGEATVTYRVVGTSVAAACQVVVSDGKIASLQLDYSATKLSFFEGEQFLDSYIHISGKAYYESMKEVTLSQEDLQITHPDIVQMGDFITVRYLNALKKIDLDVTRDEVVGFQMISPPTQTTYLIGEMFDPEGMTLALVYRSGRQEEVTDFTYDERPIQIGQKEMTFYYNDYPPITLPISVRAEREVNSFDKLQDAINEGARSIALLGEFNSDKTLVLPSGCDVVIFGKTTSSDGIEPKLIFHGVMPIKIEGNCNVTFQDISISLAEDSTSHLVDLSACTGGNITFKNVKFSSPQDAVLSDYDPNMINVKFLD